MCSTDRKEVEALKSELFRAGIRAEICINPLADALGITRLEIHINSFDRLEASRIHQEFLTVRKGDGTSNGSQTSRVGRGSKEEVQLLAEPVTSSARTQPEAGTCPDQPRAGQQGSSGGDLAQAAELLEKEVEEVLARDHALAKECAALRDRVKALDASLAQVQAELTRESSNRSAAERKLAEASDQLSTLVESLAQARAGLENEKGQRQVAEQKLSEHAAARKSLEAQFVHFTGLQARLEQENQHKREQIRACSEAMNKLLCRLSENRTAPQ